LWSMTRFFKPSNPFRLTKVVIMRSSARLASRQGRQESGGETPLETPSPPKKKPSSKQDTNTTRLSAIISSESSAEEGQENMEVDPIVGAESASIKSKIPRSRTSSKSMKDKPTLVATGQRRLSSAKSNDINAARQKLDSVLAFISKSNGNEDDSEDYDGDYPYSSPHKLKRSSSGRTINRGRTASPSRKGQETSAPQKQTSLVLKLFDRSVDLAKFINGNRDDIPLYPVCRDWIRNGRNMIAELAQLSVDPNADDKKGIHFLPKPLPLTQEQKKSGLNPRIPKNTIKPTPSTDEIDCQINAFEDQDREALLTLSTSRWKQIRTDWKIAARENELRYKHSCDVLRSMYEKSTSAHTQAETLVEPKVEPLDSY